MFKKLMDIHFITQMSNILTNKGLWWGLHEIAKQGCNFLLLLVLQPYTISPKRSQLFPFSIKIWQNFKSTTFPSDLPLSCSVKISDFCHSVIWAMMTWALFFFASDHIPSCSPSSQVYIDCILYKPGPALCAPLLEAA